MLSIVIPTFNEIKNHFVQQSFPVISRLSNVEVICVDYNSVDGTKDLIKKYGLILLESNSNSRATRMNEGIKASKGDFILLHHPRSLISIDGLKYLNNNHKTLRTWGAFTHQFDSKHPLLAFTSFWSNFIRGDIRNIYYLDHCLFSPKKLLEQIDFVPEVDIFEDTLLCLNLRKAGPAKRLTFKSTTSSIRFSKNGIYKQSLINQILKWKYYFNSNHKVMNKKYESGLDLNSKYKEK